mmetsp:Transcript_4851/g.11527  ORF Transcript_4851/g.11527 Transcript_4851/m.11527 type:complete len:328 (-) Transcript_4851:4065-5048(-)
MLIYYCYAILGCDGEDVQPGQDYNDEDFYQSVFGRELAYMADVIQNEHLETLWDRYPEKCTDLYVRDLCELFNQLQTFMEYSMGANPSHYGIHKTMILKSNHDTESLLVVPSAMGSNRYGSRRDTLVTKLQEYHTRMERIWDQGGYIPSDSRWATPCASPFLAERSTLPPKSTSKQKKKSNETSHDGTDPTPFTNKSPPFLWNETYYTDGPPTDDPVLHFNANHVISRGSYPVLKNPKSGKTKMHPVCMNSSFPSHCTCNNTGTCKTQPTAKIGAERLHIDLSDPIWASGTYKESNWAPLVHFVQTYHKHILPSPALKKLTPSTKWK